MRFHRIAAVLPVGSLRRLVPLLFRGRVVCLLAILATACGTRPSAAGGDSSSAQIIQNKGSDTLLQLAQAWAETYRKERPEVSVAVTGGGSGTGFAALINGTTDIANASRSIKPEEIEEISAAAAEPVEHRVAIDALAVIVNPANPVDALSIDQLSDIYAGRVLNWQEVGGLDAPIILLSRETNSGTHVYFLEQVVRAGDKEREDIFAPQTLLMPSSVGITSELRRNPNAIGYDGLGYVTEHEKVLGVARETGGTYVKPTVETAADGTYPLSRYLFMYTAGEPSGQTADYLDWIMGESGQTIVAKLGFVPLGEGLSP